MNGVLARWVPHPWLTVLLLVAWLWLNNSLHPGHLVLGIVLALAIPGFTRRFWPDAIAIHRPLRLLQYLLLVLYDVVVANLQVAVLILGPSSRWRPAFVRVPLELRTDFAVTVLASTVTLTPGTVSVDVEDAPDGTRVLVVHALRCTDERELVESIRQRYERRLREILEC
jgi:multicomponent K+:H+ antiporter subunit E